MLGEEPTRQNRRTWSSPPPTNTSKIHPRVEQFSQSTYWTLAQGIRHPEVYRNISTELGRMKDFLKMNRDGTCVPGKELEKRKESRTLRSPLTSGDISWDRKGASEARRRTQQSAEGRKERDRHRGSELPCCNPQPRTPAGTCRGWVLNLRLQRTDPGRGLGLAARRQPEGPGVWYGWQPGVYVEEARACHRSEAPLVRGEWREGRGLPLSSLFLGAAAMSSGSGTAGALWRGWVWP